MDDQLTPETAATLLLGKLAKKNAVEAITATCASPANLGVFLRVFSKLLFRGLFSGDRPPLRATRLKGFRHSLKCSATVHEILQRLLDLGRDYRFTAVRYYWTDADATRLVSANSAGHTPELERQLRIGELEKNRASTPLEEHDSFWTFALKRPVVIRVDRGASARLQRWRGPGGFGLVVVNHEPCQFLQGHKREVWVDFPLKVGEKWTGKLSCDYSGSLEDLRATSDDIAYFWRFVQLAAPHLEALYLKEMLGPVAEAKKGTQQCNSLDEFRRYCVEQLPAVFGGGFASLYTLSEDDLGSNLLVLRKTSEPLKQGKEDLEHHPLLAGDCLAWLAGEKLDLLIPSPPYQAPARGASLPADERVRTLAASLDDRCRDSSLMTVPIFANPGVGKPIGVYRLIGHVANSQQESPCEWNRGLLEKIANECVGPRLESLTCQVFTDGVCNYLKCAKEMSVSDCWTFSALPDLLGKTMEWVFPDSERTHKCYILSLLDENQRCLRNQFLGGKLRVPASLLDGLPRQHCFTERVLGHETFFLNNLQNRECAGLFSKITRDVVCALMARIAYHEANYGMLIVLSDRYDLLPQCHSPMLKLFADEVGEILARRRVLASTFSGLQQTIEQALDQVSRAISGGGGQSPVELNRNGIAAPLRFVHQLLSGSADLVQFNRPVGTYGPVNVHDAISQTLQVFLAGSRPLYEVHNRVDRRLKASVQEESLVLIIYALLTAWRASSPETVDIRASVHRGALNVFMQAGGRILFRVQEQGAGESQLSDDFLHGGYVRPETASFLLARRLAERHQTPDGRRGRLQVRKPQGEDGDEFLVSLPICGRKPQQSK